jgi:hypothetical protein
MEERINETRSRHDLDRDYDGPLLVVVKIRQMSPRRNAVNPSITAIRTGSIRQILCTRLRGSHGWLLHPCLQTSKLRLRNQPAVAARPALVR